MQITVFKKDKNGFSLIELMVAVVILSISTFAILEALTRYTRINIDNAMRNEAMRITEERMEILRGLPFNDLTDALVPDNGTTAMPSSILLPTTVQRSIRKMNISYAVETKISRLSFRQDGTPNSKAVRVLVSWASKGTSHQHSAASVITREW